MAYGQINSDTIQSSTAGVPPVFKDGNSTQIGTLCRAWVNFSAASGVITTAASFNVTSVTRSAAGQYAVNLANAMPDTKYAATASLHNNTTGAPAYNNSTFVVAATPNTASQVYVTGYQGNTAVYAEPDQISVAIFR